MFENHYALVIGVDDYKSNNLTDLRGATNDAKDFINWLTHNKYGKVPMENIEIIYSQIDPHRPIQLDIDEALENIFNSAINNEIENKRFYFYFSGHGFSQSMDNMALAMSNWSNIGRNRALNMKKYYTTILESGVFNEIAFFLDCCRNRKIECYGRGPEIGWPKPDDNGEPNSYIAFGTEYNDSSYEAETIIDNEKIVRGHFTRALIEGLKGKAIDNLGIISPQSLKNYIEKRTTAIAKQHNHSQKARVTNKTRDGEMIFAEYGIQEYVVKFSFSELRKGNIKLESADLSIEYFNISSTEIIEINLTNGAYVITEVDTDNMDIIRISPLKETHNVIF